jgi:hypothetical protein
MARSITRSNQKPDTLMQDRIARIRPNLLHRTAGPYKRVSSLHYRVAASLSASPQLAESIRVAKGFRVVPIGDLSRCGNVGGQTYGYSMTSSVMASTPGGMLRPSALAVFMLMTSSNLVGSCTGSSAGFPPLRMRSA